jgi:hypothetical protein
MFPDVIKRPATIEQLPQFLCAFGQAQVMARDTVAQNHEGFATKHLVRCADRRTAAKFLITQQMPVRMPKRTH